jgi:hypothetical protein
MPLSQLNESTKRKLYAYMDTISVESGQYPENKIDVLSRKLLRLHFTKGEFKFHNLCKLGTHKTSGDDYIEQSSFLEVKNELCHSSESLEEGKVYSYIILKHTSQRSQEAQIYPYYLAYVETKSGGNTKHAVLAPGYKEMADAEYKDVGFSVAGAGELVRKELFGASILLESAKSGTFFDILQKQSPCNISRLVSIKSKLFDVSVLNCNYQIDKTDTFQEICAAKNINNLRNLIKHNKNNFGQSHVISKYIHYIEAPLKEGQEPTFPSNDNELVVQSLSNRSYSLNYNKNSLTSRIILKDANDKEIYDILFERCPFFIQTLLSKIPLNLSVKIGLSVA